MGGGGGVPTAATFRTTSVGAFPHIQIIVFPECRI